METLEAVAKRASVRDYMNQPVPRDILEKLVDAGRRAPSARAVEPWEFVVITERGTLDTLAGIISTGVFLKQATACIVVFCQDTKYYLEDGSAATENILIAAADLGLGACWIAGDKKPYAAQVCELLGGTPDLKLVSLISVGWPAEDIRQNKHRPIHQVLHWGKYSPK
ncbi:MAG: nitroreductase family protein [Candidatus Omnitrophica bacterium]|nr:nitroreductase family protein [Candidatus Omnitrophota bacterium]